MESGTLEELKKKSDEEGEEPSNDKRVGSEERGPGEQIIQAPSNADVKKRATAGLGVNFGVLSLILTDDHHTSFTQLHGLSPTLQSLNLRYSFPPPPVVLDLIYSFPLLEDLLLCCT